MRGEQSLPARGPALGHSAGSGLLQEQHFIRCFSLLPVDRGVCGAAAVRDVARSSAADAAAPVTRCHPACARSAVGGDVAVLPRGSSP